MNVKLKGGFIMENGKLFSFLKEHLEKIENKLDNIEERLRGVEAYMNKSQGGLITAKDIFVILCAVGALVIGFIRLSQ